MVYDGSVRQGQAVGRPLCDFAVTVAMVTIRSRGYTIWSPALVVSVVELVNRFVVSVGEDGRFRVVVVRDGASMFLFRQVQLVGKIFRYSIEFRLFLERACASLAVAAAAGLRR